MFSPLSDPKLKMHEVKSVNVKQKDGSGLDILFYSPTSPGVPRLQPGTEMRSALLIRQQARPRWLRLRCDFKRQQSVLARIRGGFERHRPSLCQSGAGRHGATICLVLTCAFHWETPTGLPIKRDAWSLQTLLFVSLFSF